MYCPNCHQEIEDDMIFCNQCGTKVAGEPQILYKAPPQPPAQKQGGMSAAAKWIIGVAAVVVVAMVLVFVLVILPKLDDWDVQASSASHAAEDDRDDEDDRDAEDEDVDVQDIDQDAEDDIKEDTDLETGGDADDNAAALAQGPVAYTLDEIGTRQYGVFVGQGGKYYPIYVPLKFDAEDLTFEDIDFDMIPTMRADDKLVYSDVADMAFTIVPVTQISDTSMAITDVGFYTLTPSEMHAGSTVRVFNIPYNMARSYAQLYYIYVKDNQNSRDGYMGLVFIPDAVFDAMKDSAPPGIDMILPDSSSRYLSESDLWDLTQWETRLARNEIYARYGYNFKTDAIQTYFETTSWYWNDPNYGYNANKPTFNKYENYNLSLIKSYEESMGW